MKLSSILFVSSCVVVSAFGVNPSPGLSATKAFSPAFRTTTSLDSPLFRDVNRVRGGAVPGWAAYNDALDRKPLVTKAMTSLVGWGLGDILAQIFISGGPFDWKRFITLSAFGLLYHGPSGHYFYNWLDKQIPGKSAKDVASKVAIDQIFWCPIFMTVFFTYLGLVNGDSLATIANKIKVDLLSACQASWKVWPIVHAFNFRFIKTQHRLVYLNSIQVAFNMFLSILGSK
ncbi:hypothetical protein MPSEU_000338300 [Mayamaea pseudoterrestris]|nr:hypothetical protein MPSEU_000338300 [Mayamaea pseudoterrestris]